MENDTKFWFKRKRYGYGWTPTTWQGWLAVILYILFLVAGAATLNDVPDGAFSTELGVYLSLACIATASLLRLSYSKGPKPKWRWGSKLTDNLDEDI